MEAASTQLASDDFLAPGLQLGRYQLIRRLAVGGMAEVYLARATGIEGFEKLVVLKRILPQLASGREFVTMFLDEARLSAMLQHPNIAQVYDIGQYGGSYFFTMEYIKGQDVRSLLSRAVRRRQRIPLENALAIVAGAAAGLDAAHDKRGNDGAPLNIVHRDVSPSNVLVGYDGAVKVVDFGVAKAAERQSQTRSGTLKGKVSYMSPEQCKGQALDRRSDIFALGILLYEITCHKRLFKGESEYDIMSRIVNDDVEPPSATIADYPPELERILMRALSRDREKRYETAAQMQLDIEDFARENKLSLSNARLGDYLRKVFARELAAASEPPPIAACPSVQIEVVEAQAKPSREAETQVQSGEIDVEIKTDAEVTSLSRSRTGSVASALVEKGRKSGFFAFAFGIAVATGLAYGGLTVGKGSESRAAPAVHEEARTGKAASKDREVKAPVAVETVVRDERRDEVLPKGGPIASATLPEAGDSDPVIEDADTRSREAETQLADAEQERDESTADSDRKSRSRESRRSSRGRRAKKKAAEVESAPAQRGSSWDLPLPPPSP